MTTRAKVTCPFPGVRDGEFNPTTIQPGEVIEGDLAEVALREGWAAPLEPPEPEPPEPEPEPEKRAIKDAPENKARAAASRNKAK